MKIVVFMMLFFLSGVIFADQKAITDTGDEVILKSDGTWSYIEASAVKRKAISTNNKKFEKPGGSSFQLKSKRNKFANWINTKKWDFSKADSNPEAEYEFKLKDQDLYALSITEGVTIDINALADIAFDNAKSAAPDARILKKEFRVVNGKKVIYMVMTGTIQSIGFTYHGYYFSDDSGSTQLLTYTATNLVKKYRSEIDDFLNGFDTL